MDWRNLPILLQPRGVPLDVSGWKVDEDFGVHPVGSKPKRMLISPAEPPYPFIRAEHAYMFKTAEGWRAQQLWSEIIAYQIGAMVEVEVPPCFVAVSRDRCEIGALVEFFYPYQSPKHGVRFVHGADILHPLLDDPKSGRPHGARTNVSVCRKLYQIDDASQWWGRTLTFDALIGNTDRHSENWGILTNPKEGTARLAPAFDNGCSLGFQISEADLPSMLTPLSLQKFVARGSHNCGWNPQEDEPGGHVRLCARFAEAYPEARAAMRKVLSIGDEQIAEALEHCRTFDVAARFSDARVRVVAALLKTRRDSLLAALGAERE